MLRTCREDNPADPKQGRELNMGKQIKEGDTAHRKKKDKDSGTGTWRWDGWSQSSPLSVFMSTPREDLQCSGAHVHMNTHQHTRINTHSSPLYLNRSSR